MLFPTGTCPRAQNPCGHLRCLPSDLYSSCFYVLIHAYVIADKDVRVLLNDNPDIILSTPSKLLSLLQAKSLSLGRLVFLAIDEADLLMSYGHKDDLTRIMDPAMGWIPRLGVQGCLMSATLSEEVEGVKGMVLRNPVG